MKELPGRVSICASPRAVPATVHRARFDAIDVQREITEVVYEALRARGLKGRGLEVQGAHLVGEVLGQLKSFAKGQLPEGRRGAFEPVVSQPDLWEIRVNGRRFGAFRLYHAEPEGGDPDIVVLRFHQKDAPGIPSESMSDVQNRVMADAQMVFESGLSQRWGHVDHCAACLES
ncbi:MAG: hypothetical protein SPF88_08570 [Schaalia hyovaginalis]|uniref:hypothetical protein n=1 Tax=Schaalia hyovaginalis TaxID=29316 RepID=UPI002A912C45|nr:hypothetical protein [Schaalia hyovaginalis]MDY5601836.1 hypothetical protein [Schaalia hyovaginalis]